MELVSDVVVDGVVDPELPSVLAGVLLEPLGFALDVPDRESVE